MAEPERTPTGQPPLLGHRAVGRLAPSPTGLLHLGHARSFLIAWWHARHQGGLLHLRQEDLDAARSSAAFIDAAEADLRWLGLDWDGPVRVQSKHQQGIVRAAEQLLQLGLAYPCVCSRGEINAASAPHGPDGEPLYPGTCRGLYASLEAAREQTGRPAGLRFSPPDEWIEFLDGCHGSQRANPQREAGDFLILRRDGTPAYQLAVVVDDAAQGVTDVVRGDDLLPSTPRQIALIDALGLPRPRYWHVPLVTDPSGRRLAKRQHALGLQTMRAAGVEPERIVAWAANSCGLQVGTRASAAELVAEFEIEKLSKSNVRVDESEMLGWLPG
jgi:glutamyl-tRNA synthetase